MISLPEKKTCQNVNVDVIGGEMPLWKWWNVISWTKKKRRKKMNYCHNLAGGSIDTGEGHVEYFR